MRVRKLGVVVSRSLLSFTLFSLLLALVANFDIAETVDTLYSDIFSFANDEAQESSVAYLRGSCQTLLSGRDISFEEFKEICSDEEAIKRLEESCSTYFNQRAKEVLPNEDLEKTCLPIVSGDFERKCAELNELRDSNIGSMAELCEQHENKVIGDKEFFAKMMKSATEQPQEVGLSPASLIIPLSLSSIVLLSLLFLLQYQKLHEFFFTMGRILFNLGVFSVVMFLIPYAFNTLVPPDTTEILKAVTNPPPDFFDKAIRVLLPLILSRIFAVGFLYVGIVLVVLGLTLKIIYKKGKI